MLKRLNNIKEINKCANCGACYSVCPVSAISLCDTGIFYKYEVNEELCLHCGKCIRICPIQNTENKNHLIGAYWGRHKSDQIVLSSSSGGVFQALADYVLKKKNGVVFSAVYTQNCSRVEMLDSDNATVAEFKRSKYVESIVGNAFQKVKACLDMGKYVMYCGTPCQVAGLRKFIGEKDQNLLLCDFSCGGVPSHQLYHDYLQSLSLKYKSDVKSVNFRSKRYGWGVHGIEIDFVNGKKYVSPAILDPYFYGFIGKHINVRDYCYHCDFANNHYSDIILADFWKYKKFGLKNNRTGISLILTNSPVGEAVLHEIASEIDVHSIDLDSASYNIKRQEYTDEFLAQKDKFIRDYEEHGFAYVRKKYLSPSKQERVKLRIKTAIKAIINRRNNRIGE